MSKIDYKVLKDAREMTGVISAAELAKEFQITEVKTALVLKSAGVAPAGKLSKINELTGRPAIGKPSLVYPADEARLAIGKITQVAQEEQEAA